MIFSRPIPARVGGLKLWLDAASPQSLYTDSARTTLVAANNDPVGAWSDISGNGYHATQATSSKRPLYKTSGLNGTPCLQFDGTDDSMSTPSIDMSSTQVCTVFIVANIANNSAYFLEFSPSTNSNAGAFLLYTFADYAITFINGNVGTAEHRVYNTGTLSTAHAFRSEIDFSKVSSEPTTYRDGTTETGVRPTDGNNSGNLGNYSLYIGGRNNASNFLNGTISDILLYNRALTAGEKSTIQAYLKAKRGTP